MHDSERRTRSVLALYRCECPPSFVYRECASEGVFGAEFAAFRRFASRRLPYFFDVTVSSTAD